MKSHLLFLNGSVGDVVVADQERWSPGRFPVSEVSRSQTTDRRRSPDTYPHAVITVDARRTHARKTRY